MATRKGIRRWRRLGQPAAALLAAAFLLLAAVEIHGLEGDHHGAHGYRLAGAPTAETLSSTQAESPDRALCHACLNRLQANRPLALAAEIVPRPPAGPSLGLIGGRLPEAPELTGSSPRGPPALPLLRRS